MLKSEKTFSLSKALRWTPSSYAIMSAFFVVILLIVIVWWPLVVDYFSQIDPNYPIWLQLDWLLLGIFAVMSLLIMAGADLKKDVWIVFVGLCGGLVIESWGTQTHIWNYFTQERPPLWIIPAWPIASLSIDRLVRLLRSLVPAENHTLQRLSRPIYWIIFLAFYALMLVFVWPTLDKSLTWMSLLLCALLIATPTDPRVALLTFAAGAGLGYFLELWAPRENVGLTTPCRPRRFLPSWRMEWLRWLSGALSSF